VAGRTLLGMPLKGRLRPISQHGLHVGRIGDNMRSERIVAIILLLCFLSLSACARYADGDRKGSPLWGTWNWKSSTGGITGKKKITPETAGYTKQIRFSPGGEYQEFRNGELVISARYSVVIKETIFRENEVLCFSDSTGRLSDKVIMGVTSTSLDLSDPFPDGYWHAYVRVEE